MLGRVVLLLGLAVLAAQAFGDFVQTFNTFYRDTVQLTPAGGKWKLTVANTTAARSAEIKVLDVPNYYIQFVVVFNPSQESDGGPVEYTFATYPRDRKKDMVAESTWWSYGFYEPVSGDREDTSSTVLPDGTHRKLFDEQYLDDHDHDYMEGAG